jgi:hypothetical protein
LKIFKEQIKIFPIRLGVNVKAVPILRNSLFY